MKSFKQFILEKSLAGEDGDLIQHQGGRIDIHTNPKFAPRKQSVIDFVVPEEQRGKGLGHILLQKAMDKHKDLGAQVSSLASLTVFHNKGFRNPNIPKGSFDDHKKEFAENGGSLFVARNDNDGNPYIKVK